MPSPIRYCRSRLPAASRRGPTITRVATRGPLCARMPGSRVGATRSIGRGAAVAMRSVGAIPAADPASPEIVRQTSSHPRKATP